MGLFFLLVGCADKTPPQPPPVPRAQVRDWNDKWLSKKAGDTWDFTSRRIGERETVSIAPGVELHADHERLYEYSPATYTGRVFLDGSGQQGRHPAYPLYAYADEAVWKPEYGTLALMGHVTLERESVALVTHEGSEVDMDGKRIRVKRLFFSWAYSPLEVLLPQ